MADENNISLYPVGTVVYLKKGTLKLVILAKGQLLQAEDNSDELPTYYDYLAGLYPQGYDVDHMYYFNAEDIDQVVFTGLESDDEIRYQQVISEWQKNNANAYLKGENDTAVSEPERQAQDDENTFGFNF